MRRQRFISASFLSSLLAGPVLATPVPVPGQANPVTQERAVPQYERIGRFIYAYHRAGVSKERLTDPVLARRAPPELAQRASDLAEKLDLIATKWATVSDEELKATLREAEAVGPAIAQWWRDQSGQAPASPP